MCKKMKVLSCFYSYGYTTRQGKKSTRYDSRCIDCAISRRAAQYAANPEKNRAATQKWREANREHLTEYRKVKQQDASHRALKAKAQRLRKARIRANSDNRDPAISAIYQEAMDWEKKLAACVASDDPIDLCVHVDHIKPVSRGGQHVASNLRVVSAYLNLKKGASHA